jgi:ubiquinone/menaquinone biosynthesis C-methylase UbiE
VKAVSPQRWQASQRLELDFWRHWNEATPYQNLDIPKYWSEELARFGCTRQIFTGRRVLDIGCGPYGLIHFLDDAAERIRIDPLLPRYETKMALTGPQLSLAALGEQMPLASASVDVAICFNALDHMCDPDAALREIRRVLRPGGTLLLMIHTFPSWTRPFFWVDRLHPHHWTARGFASQVGKVFRIDHMETAHRRFEVPFSKWILPSSWKYLAGNLVVASTYVRASVKADITFTK